MALAGCLLAGFATTAEAAGPSTTVQLVLRPQNDAALQQLATATGLSRSERSTRLAALTPGAARRSDVVTAARALGLTVRHTSAWNIRVDGPPALVATLFGPVTGAAGSTGRAYSAIPSALSRWVVAALPSTGRGLRPLATAARSGGDFRSAYSASSSSLGAGVSIATVQLAGWDSSDLIAYAGANNIPFNYAQQYVARSVDGASPSASDGNGGDEEVALDQETLLTTAPAATQVAYFAPNTDDGTGYADAIRLVGQEAASRHTVALSLSWGGCEASIAKVWRNMMEQALEYTLAAGVTIFSATGDEGSLDCLGMVDGDAQYAPAVDFPASSPWVVAVGGTSMPVAGSTAGGQGWSMSGGGESSDEPLPGWQHKVAGHSHFHRMVPDIASEADPHYGLLVYDSRLGNGNGSGEEVLGGTSLASPTQAALLADTLADAGFTHGIGDIHPALYDAAAAGSGFTDVTSDQTVDGNGTYHSGAGYDLVTGLGTPRWSTLLSWIGTPSLDAPRGVRSTSVPVTASAPAGFGAGYIGWSPAAIGTTTSCAGAGNTSAPTSAHLPSGSPDGVYTVSVAALIPNGASNACRVASIPVILDRHAPTVTASITPNANGTATAHWSFADVAPTSGLSRLVVSLSYGGQTRWSTVATTARSHTFNALPSATWHLSVTGYDNAGNARSATAMLYDDNVPHATGSWSHYSSSAAYRNGMRQSEKVGSAMTVSVAAKRVVLYVRTCSSCGKLGVFDGHGKLVRTVDLYSSTTHQRVPVTLISTTSVATRSYSLRVLSSRNTHSHGHWVGIDALSVS